MAEVETGREARQGRKGQPVLYVLIAAVVLSVIAGVGMLTWQGQKTPPDQSQQSARETATGSGGGNPAAKEPPTNPENPTPAQPKAQ